MTAMTTQQLVDRLGRSGLRVTAASLRQDVHRGLISPLMPSTQTPGRGTPAQWSPMSVQRALRTARLRRRKVNGHVLPLLLFLDDGWGWEQILPTLQQATDKAWELDRAYLNKPTRVRTQDDLIDNATQVDDFLERADWREVRDMRTWLYTTLWSGTPAPGASPAPFALRTLPKEQADEQTHAQRGGLEQLLQKVLAIRAGMHLPASELPGWLASLDNQQVERGRQGFWLWARLLRHLAAGQGMPATNPLTLGGLSASEIAAYFRENPGRLTPAQVLGAVIAQAMVYAFIAAAVAVEESGGVGGADNEEMPVADAG